MEKNYSKYTIEHYHHDIRDFLCSYLSKQSKTLTMFNMQMQDYISTKLDEKKACEKNSLQKRSPV